VIDDSIVVVVVVVVVARVNVRVCEPPKPGAASALITRSAAFTRFGQEPDRVSSARGRDERVVDSDARRGCSERLRKDVRAVNLAGVITRVNQENEIRDKRAASAGSRVARGVSPERPATLDSCGDRRGLPDEGCP